MLSERWLLVEGITTKVDSNRDDIQELGDVAAGTEEMTNGVTLLEVVRRLNEANLLTESTYNSILQEIEQGVIQRRSQLLGKLLAQDVLEQDSSHIYTTFARIELVPTSVESDLTNIESDLTSIEVDLSELEEIDELSGIQSVIEQIDSVLGQLNSTGILSISTYEYLEGKVSSGQVFHNQQLYWMAQEQMKREEAVDPTLLKPWLDSLKAADILSEQGYDSLLKALEAAEIQNPIEFLTYIDQAQMFDLSTYSTEPVLYFPAIYQSVANMLFRRGINSGDISEFELELIPDEETSQIYELLLAAKPDTDELTADEWQTYNAVVSVEINNHRYEQTSFYGPSNIEHDFLGRIESEGIVNLFNKILRDRSSPYRLFEIASFNPHIDHSRFGVIALTEAQADVYWKGRWHGAEFANGFTSDRIAEIIALLNDIQLLNHLNEDEISEGKRIIARQYITHYHQILSAFKDVIILIDWEGAGGSTPYKHLLESLADISHKAFNPTDIEDTFDWDNQSASIAFTLNGTRYSTDLEFMGDHLDPEFFKFVESVAVKESLEGKFYPLSDAGYDVEGYIFLDDRQLRDLLTNEVPNLKG